MFYVKQKDTYNYDNIHGDLLPWVFMCAQVFSIIEQVNEKKKKNSEEEEQKVQVGQERQSETIKGKDQHTEDDFEPLRVTEYIKNELKQS